jgi:hypothetical protein
MDKLSSLKFYYFYYILWSSMKSNTIKDIDFYNSKKRTDNCQLLLGQKGSRLAVPRW